MLGERDYADAKHLILTKNSQSGNDPNGFVGKVEFNLGKIDHPKFSNCEIKGSFPRVKPKYKRLQVTDQEKQAMKAYLFAWFNEFFDAATISSDVNQLTETATAFAGYANPNHEFGSVEMNLICKFLFWIDIFDEVIESAVCNHAAYTTLENGISQLLPVFEFQEKEFKEVENFPSLRSLFHSFVDVRDSFVEHNPNFRDQLWSCAYHWRKYFEASRWCAVAKFSGEYSEDLYRYWRKIVACGAGALEHIWILSGGPLPEAIFRSVSFTRLCDNTDSIIACTNDVLGIKNELQMGMDDNWLLFKIIHKGIPVERAVEEVCAFVTRELRDYVLLKKSLLEEFSYHPALVSYLEVLDSFVDGHNRYYTDCPRYKISGSVKLID